MNFYIMKFTNLIPVKIRRILLKLHHRLLWPIVLKKYRKAVFENEPIKKSLLKKLIYAWGNQGFSAQTDYLESCIHYVKASDGSILECGSGLSTILLGIIAQKKGLKIVSLEHAPAWAQKVNHQLEVLGLNNCTILSQPLIDMGEFSWYDIDKENFPLNSIEVIICDGPPADTKGGRFGLVPVLREYITSGTKILVDDVIREQEQEMIKAWSLLIAFQEERKGEHDPHSILEVI